MNRSLLVLKANVIRNLRIDWKYKLNFITDLAWLAVDVITFLFLGQLVAATNITNFDFDGKLKEFLVVGVIYWVIFTRAYKDGIFVIPEEAARGALGFIITNDVSLSDLITGQFTSSTIKTSFTLVVFVLPAITLLSIIPIGPSTILQPFKIDLLIIVLVIIVFLISWLFMLSLTIIASTLNVLFKKSGPLAFLIVSLLTMFSGYYFPLEVLRTFNMEFLEQILYLIPTTNMVYMLRRLLILGTVSSTVITDLILTASISIFFYLLSLIVMKKVTRKSAYSGTLEFY